MSFNAQAARTAEVADGMSLQASKYLTFDLASEAYGLEILKVQEIIGIMPVTRVPRTPEFIRGVVNLRGKVIPVVDLRLKFKMESKEDTRRTSIVVVQVMQEGRQVTMGLIVDDVSEVIDIDGGSIEPAPEFGASVNTDFIMGIAKLSQRVIILLDVDKVLSNGDAAILEQVVQRQ